MAALPEDKLAAAAAARQPLVLLEHCRVPLDELFRRALKKERRLLAMLSGYQAGCMQKGGFGGACYQVSLFYQEDAPASLDEVLVDDGDWDESSVFAEDAPRELLIVARDPDMLDGKLSALMLLLISSYEGLFGWRSRTMNISELSSDTLCRVAYDYLLPERELQLLRYRAEQAAADLWEALLGRAQVPKLAKPFLAFSYLAQECRYDEEASDDVVGSGGAPPKDAVPYLAYGPLIEKRGVCSGFAWAFKRLMDAVGIECRCIAGCLTSDPQTGHMWNLVRLDGQYYHVDPTSTVKMDGVCTRFFMRSDSFMKATHAWNEAQYPQARGMRFSCGFIEDFLAENGEAYLDDGAAAQYLFPENIVE